ncbi:MAG: alcohol dehydrogenase catalytic domain-containing protein [Deltaproteobacteria bacterium]|nr:alcohol dehydrogenase catalytic domain-containing protein [Deltaproteobacteria bacterium]MBI3078949.1 alcohol dehydrogenase catalytic domain-containing protein [Deltaproteobacteria bacterium]
MQAIVYPQPNEFRLQDLPVPSPGPDQVLIRVRSTTICATDFKIFAGQFPGTKFPHIPGHEWSGEVVEVGSRVAHVKPGDRVGVEVHVGCGACPPCLNGLYTLCEHYGDVSRGHAHIGFTVPGGMAECCAVPARAVHRLPDPLDFDEGAFTDNIGVALYAVERGGLRAGEGVAVLGPGAFGLLAVQVARALGAGRIVLVGTRQERLRLGRELGADEVVNAAMAADPVAEVKGLFEGKGPQLVVEFAGTEAAAAEAIQMARRGGRVVLAGATAPGRTLQVDLSLIVRGHLDVHGSLANPKAVSARGLELISRGVVKVKPLITHHFPLEAFGRAWEAFRTREGGAYRVMLHPAGT